MLFIFGYKFISGSPHFADEPLACHKLRSRARDRNKTTPVGTVANCGTVPHFEKFSTLYSHKSRVT